MAGQRLEQLLAALGDRRWLVGEHFTIADLMMVSVLKIARGLDLLEDLPTLGACQDRCLDRPAYRTAIAEQCADIARHAMVDMKCPSPETPG